MSPPVVHLGPSRTPRWGHNKLCLPRWSYLGRCNTTLVGATSFLLFFLPCIFSYAYESTVWTHYTNSNTFQFLYQLVLLLNNFYFVTTSSPAIHSTFALNYEVFIFLILLSINKNVCVLVNVRKTIKAKHGGLEATLFSCSRSHLGFGDPFFLIFKPFLLLI